MIHRQVGGNSESRGWEVVRRERKKKVLDFGLEYKCSLNLVRQQKFICRVCLPGAGTGKELLVQHVHQLPAVVRSGNSFFSFVINAPTASQQVNWSNHLLLTISDSLSTHRQLACSQSSRYTSAPSQATTAVTNESVLGV